MDSGCNKPTYSVAEIMWIISF